MHSTLRFKICICSVIFGEQDKGFSIVFPKMLDAI